MSRSDEYLLDDYHLGRIFSATRKELGLDSNDTTKVWTWAIYSPVSGRTYLEAKECCGGQCYHEPILTVTDNFEEHKTSKAAKTAMLEWWDEYNAPEGD